MRLDRAPTARTETAIPLFGGSATATGTSYTTVAGALATVDLSKYGKVESVIFECVAKTSNASYTTSVQLYDLTNTTAIASSIVTTTGTDDTLAAALLRATLTISQLDTDAAVLAVQMKTSDGAGTATLTAATLVILTN